MGSLVLSMKPVNSRETELIEGTEGTEGTGHTCNERAAVRRVEREGMVNEVSRTSG